jgi:hypothetical protein
MGKTSYPWGALLYRCAFAVFVGACILNAYDAYTTAIQANFRLVEGVSTVDKMNEAWAFLGLAFILTLEGAGLMLYKWARHHVQSAMAM